MDPMIIADSGPVPAGLGLQISSALAAAALILAAADDARHRRIPNRASLVVALTAVPMLLMLDWRTAGLHLGLALLMFALGAFAFTRGWLGGGDVKLLAAVALWSGPVLFPLFTVVLALSAVVIAVLMLLRAALPSPLVAAGDPLGRGLRAPLPLGVAIATGGIVVLLHQVAILPWGAA